MVTKKEFEGNVLVVSKVLDNYGLKWFMDSGCTYHMCPRREWFNQIQGIDGGNVLIVNN